LGNIDLSLIDRLRPVEVVLTEDNGETKQLFALADGHMYLYKRDEVIEVLEKTLAFYRHPEVDQLVEEQNNINRLRHMYDITEPIFQEIEEGIFQIPKSKHTEKTFRKNLKRDWSFSCSWCNKKVSSKTDSRYYVLYNQRFHLDARACSVACADLLWKEAAKEWIHTNGYQKYFKYE